MSALSLGLIAALCWGFHDICIRFLSQKIPLTACLFVVLVTGLIFHAGLTVSTDTLQAVPAHAVWLSLGAGVFLIVASAGLYLAFQRGPVRLVAPLIAGYPILSVAIAAFAGSTITALQLGAVLAIVIGVAAVAALSDDSDDDTPPIGPTIALSCFAAIGFAMTFALGQAAADLSHEMPTTLISRAFGLCLVVVALLVIKRPFWPGKSTMPMLILMGIADSIALYCVMAAGGLPDAQYAAVTSSMFGLLTIVLAWLFLKERMTPAQWAGCAVAFCGVGVLAL